MPGIALIGRASMGVLLCCSLVAGSLALAGPETLPDGTPARKIDLVVSPPSLKGDIATTRVRRYDSNVAKVKPVTIKTEIALFIKGEQQPIGSKTIDVPPEGQIPGGSLVVDVPVSVPPNHTKIVLVARIATPAGYVEVSPADNERESASPITVAVAAPTRPLASGASLQPRTPLPTQNDPRKPASSAAPPAPSGPPYTVTTGELSIVGGAVTGTGTPTTFSPIVKTAGELSIVGGEITGPGVPTSFTPIVKTTGELSIVGR